MRIPTRDRAGFARDLIVQCTNSRNSRIERGVAFRNIFYTGNADGTPQTYLRTQDLVRDLQSFIYSASDLRFGLDFYGSVSEVTRAKGRAVASYLYEHTRQARVDTAISTGVLSSLIKGKALLQMVWRNRTGQFEPWVVQPELFGVLREDIPQLDRQEAFCHTTFMTPSRFSSMVMNTEGMSETRKMEIIRGAARHVKSEAGGDGLPSNSVLKQIMVGGISPYTSTSSPASTAGGQVMNWLYAPQASFRPDVTARLIPYETLWIWNDAADDWATISMVGDTIVYGEVNYNAFAEAYKPKSEANTPPDRKNPLIGKHPYVDFAPWPMEDYFWGWSAVQLVTLLQHSINNRIDGINTMLRKQEDPPRFMSGSQSVNQNAYAKLNRPGGYWTDGNPGAKIQDIVREIPRDVWQSFHELNGMFDLVAGMPAVTRGEGEAGVRSQGHADRLVQMGTARHKEPALEIERSIEEWAGLMLSVLQAKDESRILAWVKPGVQSEEIDQQLFNPGFEPPVKGMQQVWFNLWHLPDNVRVTTDGHSQSPAFTQEAKLTAMALNQRGAMSPQRLVEATHPQNAEALIEDLDRKEVEQAELIRTHPELLEKALGGGGRRKTH